MDSKKLLLVSVGSVLVVLGLTAILVLRHPAKPRVMRHPMTGYVLEVRPEKNIVTVRNDDMPGVMRAMVMDYPVKGTTMLKELKPGDLIQATMVMDNSYWLENIKVTGKRIP
jgi:Cu/Ag efflux protein CusF